MPSRKKRNAESEREEPAEAPAAPRRPLRRTRAGRAATVAPSPSSGEPGPPAPEPSPLVAEFAATEPFPLDPFQIEACEHLAAGRSALVAAPTGTGKALAATTPALTPLGWKLISEICVGDSVIGSQGKPTTVLGVYPQGKRPAYRVTFSDGVSVICDIDHLWAVNTKSRRSEGSPWRVLTLGQIMAEGLADGEGRRHFIPIVKPVEFCQPEIQRNTTLSAIRQETGITQRGLAALLGVSQAYVGERELGHKVVSEEYRQAVEAALTEVGPQPRLEPYLLGLLLGDGNFSTGVIRFTSADDEIIASARELLPRGTILQKESSRPYDWFILSHKVRTHNPAVTELVKLNLMGRRAEHKFIPHQYKFASIEDRLAILQGLLDSDGSIDERGLIEYTTVSRILAEDMTFLVRSLGGRTRIHEKPTNGQLAYRLLINMPNGAAPFRLSRKLARCRSERKYYPTRSIDAVELVGEAEMVCISVDALDGLFVINDFIVTHNTVVADCAIWLAQREGQRAIYTAPVKALSNQKYRDLRARHGDARVGLLTGDIVENPAAPILVMTTEIYRNMLLEGSRAARELPGAQAGESATAEASDVAELARRSRLDEELSGVSCVVFDEMHFIGDPERGPVWEEAIIHSPAHVIFVGLSATVSNADELRQWIERAHGPMGLVFHAERAVPLEHYYFFESRLRLAQDANGLRVERFDGIGGETKLARMRNRGRRYTFGDDANQQTSPPRDGRPYWAKRPRSENPASAQQKAEEVEEPLERPAPEPGEILTALRAADLLPCLYFLPGRKAVEAAAIGATGHLLVTPEQRARLHVEVQQWVKALPPDDQRLEQVGRLADLLPRGLGFHHAGLLPALKLWVETLFARGDLKAVFSTDTLALGINMPARCVVVGSLSKFDGEQMRLLTPNEYQQLTGRAGRRGMDAKGAAVIPYSPWDAFEPAFRALTAPLLPVTSAFAIRYNTVLNLWRPHDMERLRRAVAMSLREFQRFDRKRQRAEDWHVKTYGTPPRRPQEQTLGKAAAQELYATVYVLRALGYINEDDELSVRGRLLRAIFHSSGIMLADLLLNGALDALGPAEVAEVVSWFTYDGDRLRNLQTLPNRLVAVRRQVWRTQRLVQDLELTNGLTVTQATEESFHSVALRWWRGTSLGGLLRNIDLAEGDLLVSLNQTIDLLQQLQGAVGQTVDARDLWQATDRRAERELEATRERLGRLRPVLGTAWRGMLRGSVALSRTIPSMATPDAPVAPMAEDTDPDEAKLDRAEAPPDAGLPDDVTGG